MSNFSEKRKARLAQAKVQKEQKILQDFGNKGIYWAYQTFFYILLLIAIMTKSGFIPTLVILGTYYLVFTLLFRKFHLKAWLSIIIALIIAIIAFLGTLAILWSALTGRPVV